MRFWDSSAIVPLLVREATSDAMTALAEADPEMLAWWATPVECLSAIARLERDGLLDASVVARASAQLAVLSDAWIEVQPTHRVRQTALRLLRVHPLRAADAFQLAAAIVASDERPDTLPFMTLDGRLARAAEREGFAVIEPA